MRYPLGDWQFLAVTAAVLGCAALLVRAVARAARRPAGCEGCGPRRRAAPRVTLTLQGRRLSRSASRSSTWASASRPSTESSTPRWRRAAARRRRSRGES